MGTRSPEGREEFRRFFDSAIDVPGPATDALGDAARAHRLYLVVGVVEREGGTLYCTALFFGPDGALLGKHRKLMPTALERLVWGQGDGSTLTVLDTEVGKLGAVICWENYMPLLRMAMYAKGVQLYCAPTVDDRDTWLPTMRHVALEGRCFVLSACQYLTRADCPSDYACPRATTPRRSSSAAAAASWPRWGKSSPARSSAARASSPPTWTWPTSPGASTTSTSPATTPAPTSSGCTSTIGRRGRWPQARSCSCNRPRTGKNRLMAKMDRYTARRGTQSDQLGDSRAIKPTRTGPA
jgi:hypothetical protein